MILQPSQFRGMFCTGQVGSSGAAEQHRAPGEHAYGLAGVIAERVTDVVVGVPWRAQRLEVQPARMDPITVADGPMGVADLFPGGKNVLGAGGLCERQAASD